MSTSISRPARALTTRESSSRWVPSATQPVAGVVDKVDGTARQPVPSWPNLVHDTFYRKARASIARAIHRADDAIFRATHGRRHVLFEAASPMSVAVYRPVLKEIQKDPRIECWFTSFDPARDSGALFGSLASADHVLPARRVAWQKFDAYINADFWDMTWLHRHTKRMHFFHGVAGKYRLDAPVDIAPVVASFDRLMFTNLDRLGRYAEAGLVDARAAQSALVGYPKVDCLVDGSLDRGKLEARLGLRPGVPTVLYAPTWSPYSSLNAMGSEIIATLARLDVNVLVKLHDRSYDVTARGSGGVDWRAELARLNTIYDIHVVEDSDISPYLHAADLLVTDHSSAGFEFTLLDRPIVVMHCPELLARAYVNPQKAAALQRAAYVVERCEDLRTTVTHALTCPREHQVERRALSESLFYRAGTATARAVAVLYDLLDMEPPTTAGTVERSSAGGFRQATATEKD